MGYRAPTRMPYGLRMPPFAALDGDLRAATDEFRFAIDTLPGLVWGALPDGDVDFLNQRWPEYTGMPLERARGRGWLAAISPEDRVAFTDTWDRVVSSGAPAELIARLRRVDGADRSFLFRAVPRYDERGVLVKWYGHATDIEDHVRAEALLAGEKRVLEMLAKGIALPRILDALCALAEAMSSGLMASILLLDRKGERLLHGAAPGLPPDFARALNGSAVDCNIGPCGSAAYYLEPVFIADIAAEPRWADFRGLASTYGLRSCWSSPILSLDGRILGTFAIYSRTPGAPSSEQRNVIEQIVNLTSVAVERGQAEEALRRSEMYHAEAQRLSLTGSFSWHVVTGEITWSDETYRIYGYDRAIKPSVGLARARVHPDDVALFDEMEAASRQQGRDLRFAHRLRMPDGTVRYVQVVSTAIRDTTGRVVEYIGAVRDVTERKRAERALRRARLRELETRYGAMMEERTRIAREIHDTVLQGFNGVALLLMAAAGKVTSPPDAVTALQSVLDLAEKALGDARRAVWDLRTPALADDLATTLRIAAEDAVRGTGLSLDFRTGGNARTLGSASEAALFRVMHEALTNTIKHAGAQHVRVRVSYGPRRIRLSVRDDGRGFAVDPDFRTYGGHWGLLGMRERATQVGATLAVRSTIGRGTAILLTLP